MDSPDSPDQKPYPGLWQAIGICALYLMAMFVLIVPLVGLGTAFDVKPEDSPASMALVTLLATVWLLSLYRAKTSIAPDALAGPIRVPPVILLPIALTVIGLLLAETPILLWLAHRFPALRNAGDYNFKQSPPGAFVLLVLVAPLTEELIFRAMFLRGFAARYGATRGLALSATLFAAAHYYPIKLLGTFVVGLLFGWLYLRFKSIWPGVVAHALNNLIALLLIMQPAEITQPVANGLFPAGAVLAAAGFWALRRVCPPP